jgi:diguanylate cyclase (GGDEF)-like protein/PAS domain S-box-containing protein
VDPNPTGAVRLVASLEETARLEVLDALPDPILVVDARCLVRWGNHAAARLFGRSLDESIGVCGLDLVHPDDLEFALLSMESVQRKEVGLPIEVRLLSATGWRLVELIGSRLPGSDGDLVLSIRDLTDRRTFEVAAGDEARFRSVVHNSPALMLQVAADGRVLGASGAVARLLGRDPGVVSGRPLSELVDRQDVATLASALSTAAVRPPGARWSTTIEVGMPHLSQARTVPMELTIVNLLDDPTVGSFVISGHDITARKQVEAELRSTLALLSATLDSTDDGILVTDHAGNICSANRRFVELWRIPEDVMAHGDDAAAIAFVLEQLSNPEAFLAKVNELYAQPEAESHDVLPFLDGRVFDRYSRPHRVEGEVVGRVWSFRDVTENRQLEEQLAHQALHDSLTDLANQSLFRDRLGHALARRGSEGSIAVLFLDVDNFKTVNDSLGHLVGDLLLVGAADRLTACLRPSDTAARLGGDEFAILLEDVECEEDAMAIAQRVLRSFSQPFEVDGTEVSASVSIGVAFSSRASSCEQLLRNADLAMYTAKRLGKGRVAQYQSGMHASAVQRLELEAELRRAVERDELVPHYQPIVDLVTRRIVGVEALVRWEHPTRGLLTPADFLGVAEEAGLLGEVGRIVLEEGCTDLGRWMSDGCVGPDFSLSVNVSPEHLMDSEMLEHLQRLVRSRGIDAAALTFEITEGAMMRDPDAVVDALTDLRRMGVRIAIDDFGTGYSSLAYLQRLPVDVLKVDKSFVDGIDGTPEESALPHAIIRLAHTLHLTAVAEGVERVSQEERLRSLGCERAQGYLFSRPVPAASLPELLRADLG